MSSSDILSSEECYQIVKTYLGNDKFKVINIAIVPLGGAPVGFMSDHLRIKIKVLLPDGITEELKFFTKTSPRNVPLHSEFVNATGSYIKETGLYSKLLPDLRQQHKKGEQGSQGRENLKTMKTGGTCWAPQCYFTRSDIIVLEDLAINGFKPFNNREVMDHKHCVAVLGELASLHAATIAYEENKGNVTGKVVRLIDLYPDVFLQCLTTSMTDDDTKGWFQAGVRTMLPLVDLLPKYQNNPDLCSEIRKKIPETCDQIYKFLTKSEKFRNVTCHGDLWANNIMFNYGADGQPLKVRFVDFQLVRYLPPATDVVVFLHVTTTRVFRERHMEELLDAYHKMFAAGLKSYGLDAENLLSLNEFRNSCEHLRDLGRITAALYYQMIIMKGEITESIFSTPEEFNRFMLWDRSAEVCESFRTDDVYRERMNEAMEEFIDYCVLKH